MATNPFPTGLLMPEGWQSNAQTSQTNSSTGQRGRWINGQWETLLGPNSSPQPNVMPGSGSNLSSATSSQPSASQINPETFQNNFSAIYPNAGITQSRVSNNISTRLRGELSPETLNAIQDQAARFGIGSGTPGSGISGSYGRKLLGQTVEGLQSQGLQDYLNTLKTYSGTLMPTTEEAIGAETSRYGTDVGARTSANALGQQAYQFGITFPESQRQFDIGQANNMEQFFAGLDQNYLNSYLNFLT